jgi:NUMOD1 domain
MKIRLNRGSSAIYNAIIKYGHSNFSLDILEYCKPNELISREQYYIDTLNPEYNILKTAGSRLGKKLSYETKKNIGEINRSINKNKAKFKTITFDTKLKISSRSIGVKIFDQSNNLINEFPSITIAAKNLGINTNTIRRIFNRGISYDNFVYKFEVKDNKILIYDRDHKLIKVINSIKKHLNYIIYHLLLYKDI